MKYLPLYRFSMGDGRDFSGMYWGEIIPDNKLNNVMGGGRSPWASSSAGFCSNGKQVIVNTIGTSGVYSTSVKADLPYLKRQVWTVNGDQLKVETSIMSNQVNTEEFKSKVETFVDRCTRVKN